jgi:hypothetical protein
LVDRLSPPTGKHCATRIGSDIDALTTTSWLRGFGNCDLKFGLGHLEEGLKYSSSYENPTASTKAKTVSLGILACMERHQIKAPSICWGQLRSVVARTPGLIGVLAGIDGSKTGGRSVVKRVVKGLSSRWHYPEAA